MKRLFCVKDLRGRVVKCHAPEISTEGVRYFDNKMVAKKHRDILGGVDNGFHVSRGPDHMGKHGMGRVPTMRRQPKQGDRV